MIWKLNFLYLTSMGASSSQKLMRCIESGDEAGAIKILGARPNKRADAVDAFKLAYAKRRYDVMSNLFRNFDGNLIQYVTDADMMTDLVNRMLTGTLRYKRYDFASTATQLAYLKAQDCGHLIHNAMDGIVESEVGMLLSFLETQERRTVSYIADGGAPLRSIITGAREIIHRRNGANSLILIQKIKDKHGETTFKEDEIDLKLIHENESILMIALKNGAVDLAYTIVPKVNLAHECKGRNALHYAIPYKKVFLKILDHYTPYWDMEFLTTDMGIMKVIVDKWNFRRADYLKMFERMTHLQIADEDLRTFFDLIRDHIANSDIPDLLRLVDKFPLTHDKLSLVLQPSTIAKMELTLAKLQALVPAEPAAVVVPSAPPAYSAT